MTMFDFDFRSRTPAGPLGRAVASIWYARGRVPYRRERIAPTGSSVALIVLGDPIIETALGARGGSLVADRGFLIGPHDRPVINEPAGETFAVGVVTTPVGCAAVFGSAPGSVAGRVVPLEVAWAAAARVRADLLRLADPEAITTRRADPVRALARARRPRRDIAPFLGRAGPWGPPPVLISGMRSSMTAQGTGRRRSPRSAV